MGSKIELLRMTIYVFFPVTVFYYFNMPNFYEEYVQKRMSTMYPSEEDYKQIPKSLEEIKTCEQLLKERKINKTNT